MTDVIFTRSDSPAAAIERMLDAATASIAVALYRLSHPGLMAGLERARERGLAVRVVLNSNDHYEENRAAQSALAASAIPFRLLEGRSGAPSKMHHKFAVLDRATVLAGSYNWTLGSEERNYEHLLVLHEPRLVAAFAGEFEALWTEGRAAQDAGPHAEDAADANPTR